MPSIITRMFTFDTKFGPFFRCPNHVTLLQRGSKNFFIFSGFWPALRSLLIDNLCTSFFFVVHSDSVTKKMQTLTGQRPISNGVVLGTISPGR